MSEIFGSHDLKDSDRCAVILDTGGVKDCELDLYTGEPELYLPPLIDGTHRLCVQIKGFGCAADEKQVFIVISVESQKDVVYFYHTLVWYL